MKRGGVGEDETRRGYTITPPAPHRARDVGGYQKMAEIRHSCSEIFYIIHIMRRLVVFFFYINDLVYDVRLFSPVTADYLTGPAQCFGPIPIR